MRYYDLTLSDAKGKTQNRWTSHPNGARDPGALNVQLDLIAAPMATPGGACTISLDGIGLAALLQSQQYTGMTIAIKGGMQKGLPLANPSQAGVLLKGQVFQSFGNWQGSEQNLNFVVVPGGNTFSAPANFVFSWQLGQPLADAIANTLNLVYPGVRRSISIAGSYAPQGPITATCHSLTDFAQFVKAHTKTDASPGVDIAVGNDGGISVSDGTTPAGKALQLLFTDLIGQPKWVDLNLMQLTLVMRADIQVFSTITMPKQMPGLPGLVTTSAASQPSQMKYKTSFQGQFLVTSVRHIGNFRDADGASWVTIVQAYPQTVATAV